MTAKGLVGKEEVSGQIDYWGRMCRREPNYEPQPLHPSLPSKGRWPIRNLQVNELSDLGSARSKHVYLNPPTSHAIVWHIT